MVTIISSTNRKGANSYKLAKIYERAFQQKDIAVKLIDLEKLPDDFLHTTLYENNGKNEISNGSSRGSLAAEASMLNSLSFSSFIFHVDFDIDALLSIY